MKRYHGQEMDYFTYEWHVESDVIDIYRGSLSWPDITAIVKIMGPLTEKLGKTEAIEWLEKQASELI